MTAMKNFPTGIAMLVKYIVVALPHFPQVIGSARLCAAPSPPPPRRRRHTLPPTSEAAGLKQ